MYFLINFCSLPQKLASRPDRVLSELYMQLYSLITQISYYKNNKKQQQLGPLSKIACLWVSSSPTADREEGNLKETRCRVHAGARLN